MRFRIRLLQLMAALLVGLPLSADPDAPQPDFPELIRQIWIQNEFSPFLSRDLVDQAERYLSERGTVEDQIELAIAAAPYLSMELGYEGARKRLLSLMNQARLSTDNGELVPGLLVALADLGRRYGDTEFALEQLGLAYRFLPHLKRSDLPDEILFRLLHQTIQVLYGSPELYASTEMLDFFTSVGGMEEPYWRARILISRARVAALSGDLEELKRWLDAFADDINGTTEPGMAKVFWLLKGYAALMENQVNQAERFLETAENLRGPGMERSREGSVFILRALIAQRRGESTILVRQYIAEARRSFYKTGEPADFCSILGLLLRPSLLSQSPAISPELLQPLSTGCVSAGNLFFSSDVALAEALSLRRAGNAGEAVDKVLLSRQLVLQAILLVGKLELDIQKATPWILREPARDPPRRIDFYLLVVLLLMVILVLLLFLRVRTQQLINQSLEETIEKSRIAEREAEQASRLKSQFLSNVSHELKTPMSGLVGMTSILEELINDPVQRKYLHTIRDCSRNMMVLVNDLLDLGRMESGRLDIEHVPFSIRETLAYCTQMVAQSAKKKKLDLSSTIDQDMPDYLIGDPTRLGQVLINLLTNAIKFTNRGSVQIHAWYLVDAGHGNMLEVTITDTGPGIPEDQLDLIFEPFQQGKQASVAQEGSGLGLAISHKLTQVMGGFLTVDSKVGKGSAFMVRLPFPPAEAEAEDEP